MITTFKRNLESVKDFTRQHPYILASALFFGMLLQLAYDFWVISGTTIETLVFWMVLPLRIATYATLFVTCRLLADHFGASIGRTWTAASVWSLIGLTIAAATWYHLVFDSEIYRSWDIYRYTPDTPSHRSTNETLAEFIFRGRVYESYTWRSAITREFVIIAAVSFVVASFVRYSRLANRVKLAYLAPVVAFVSLMIMAFYTPWSFTWGSDVWIGDALVGPMIYNGLFFYSTLIAGGFAAPMVWVYLLTIANLLLLDNRREEA